MKKKVVISAACAVILVVGVGGYVYASNNRFELLEDTVQLEYKGTLDTSARAYVDASEHVLEQTKIDLSKVDINAVGKYPATAEYKDKELKFSVIVKDTIAPALKMKDPLKGVAGKQIAAADLIKSMNDAAGIKSVTFEQNQQGEYVTDLNEVSLFYDAPGTYENTLTVEDTNGNKTEKDITIKIVEDYEAHVTGIADIVVEQNSDIDWIQGITYDNRIAGVTVDATGVDLAVPGEYTLKYVITGDDQETTVEKAVKVTVVTAEDAQNRANNGETVKITGGVKEKYVPAANTNTGNSSYSGAYSDSSYSGTGSGGSSYGSSSSGGSYSGGGTSSSNNSSSSGNSGSGFTPGQSWDMNKTDEGYIDGPNGNWAESGTWNPFG